MATSGYKDEYVTKYDTLRFSWSRVGYSIADNTSTVNWSLQLISTAYGAISSTATKAWSVNVNGQGYSGTNTVGIGANTTKTLASGSTVIAHNTDGTKSFAYSFSQQFNINFNGNVGTVSGSSTGTLDTIPRYSVMTNATDFTDEGNPTIYFTNPSNGHFALRAKIEAGGNSQLITRNIPATSTSYTFSLTDSERKILRQLATSNSLGVLLTICCMNGSTELSSSYVNKTMTMVNCTPTLNPTVVDQGSVSTTLTGDSNKIILNYNTVKVAFNATALKEASISSTKVTCGNATLTSDGIMEYVSSGTFVFTVTDSRGNSASKTITKDTIDYTPLTCNLSANPELVEGSTANIDLTVKGRYFEGSFGAVTNSLTVEYRYKINDGDYPNTWTSITGTLSNGEYTAQATVSNLDYKNSYTFQARAKDAVYTSGVETPAQVVRIVPVFDWSESDFNFNVPVHSRGGFTEDITVLDSGNCDEIRVSGRFYIGTNGTNKPGSGANGWLTVQTYGTENCYQEYITYNGLKYYRMRDENGWGVWVLTDGGVCTKSIATKPWASVNSGNGETRTYYRVGNVVFLNYVGVYQAGQNSYPMIEQAIPVGYRPAYNVYVTYLQLVSNSIYGHGRWRGNSDGTSYADVSYLGYSEHIFNTSWITNDPFPTE